MRLYIRNKEKYDPSKAGKALVFVEFADPRVFSVGQVKEEFKKKARAAKIDSLYFRQEDGSYEVLADDRTVGFYNIQNDAILETTSNPLWAAAIYYRLREVERDAADRVDDPRAARGLEQSLIQKYMALGILFNGGNNRERQQPPHFEELDQLFEHLQTAGKKPVHMSQQTLDTLQQLKDDYEQNDVHERDSIGHFVRRQAVKLGLTSKESNGNGKDQRNGVNTDGDGEVERTQGAGNRRGRGRGNIRGKRPNGVGRAGRRAPQKQRMCEDCEENAATQFCADCQPPLVLCDNCAVVLHRGATRRNHQLKDVSEAPAPAKGYTPKAYRAPFAMLVAFHRAFNEVPSKMSLTTDELKSRAQPLTNTDLEIKQGRWFGGFDSLENALMKNDLVQKEARTPKYSLLEKGQPLAARCSEFDYAVQNLTQAASVPTIPVMAARPVFRSRQVCLLVDSEEPLRERFVRVALQRGLSAKTRKLPVGDFLWVLLPPGVNPDTVRDMPEQELVLPMIVERKTWDDLWSSLKTTRFVNQVHRMKNCGLENLFYLVEGSPKELKGNPGPEVESFLQDKIDSLLIDEQFLVNRTGSWLKTVEWLCHLTNMAIESLQSEGRPSLMTYSEFLRGGKLNKKNLTSIATASAVPATSTVWSATEFTDVIRSHSHGGMELRNLPVSFNDDRSLIVIQGLTLYNKQCHKLLDKALADLLENTHQTAEACVQRHLQGVTDQLIHEDVPQWYILWLQVFKGVIVRRTDTEEESAEILGRFYQTSAGGLDALIPRNEEGDHIRAEKAERLPEDDLMFASDSQEEDAMIRQALRASQFEEKMPEDNVHPSLVRPPSSTTTKPSVEQLITSSSENKLQRYSLDSMNEREQLELAMQLSKAENEAGGIHGGHRLGHGEPSAKTPVTSSATEQHKASSHTPGRPRTKMDVRKSTHTDVCVNKTKSDGTNDELEVALKQSLEEFENMKQKQDDRGNISDTASDLEKALELSRLDYGQSSNNTMSHKVQRQSDTGGPSGMDEELQRALELGKLETEVKEKKSDCVDMLIQAEVEQSRNQEITGQEQSRKDTTITCDDDLQKALEQSRVEYEQYKSDTLMTLNKERESETKIVLDTKGLRQHPTSEHEDDLAKALEISRTDYNYERGIAGNNVLDETKRNSSKKSKVQDLQEDDDLANALKMSKMECRKLEDSIGLPPMHGSKDQTMDSDLERALKLSRIEYIQSTNCSLDGKQEDSQSDITIVEEDVDDFQPRERIVPALKLTCSSTPTKDSCLFDDPADDVVPSSVTSEWDPDDLEKQGMFNALDGSTPAGISKCSAILLDSQGIDDEFLDVQEVPVEDVAKTNRKRLFSLREENTVGDDFAYALKLQEELNEQVKSTDNCHNPPRKRRTTCLELEDQLTSYRESQKEKYGTVSGKGDKSSRGLDFRRNAAAIACGKPVQIGIASPISRPGHSQKRQDSHRVLGDKPSSSSRIDREKNGLLYSPKKQSLHKDEVYVIRDDDTGCKTTGSTSRSLIKRNDERSFLPWSGTTSSPRPISSSASSSSFERVHKRDPPTFLGPHSPSSVVHSPSVTPSKSTDTSHVNSSSDKPMGPKCGACGEVGHNKNSKICPHYFSAEAVQRREEQSRKRKAKKEEEERDLNDRLGAMAAQRLVVEERTRTITEQLDELRRQSENMAKTQKMVEDVIKRKRKR